MVGLAPTYYDNTVKKKNIFIENLVTQIFIKEFDRITFHINLKNKLHYSFQRKISSIVLLSFFLSFSQK